jgi:hypothetical protein
MSLEHPDPELAEYRPLNRLSVAALLVGLASPLALLHPMLWCIPAAGIVLAAAALWSIRHAEIPTIGRKGAILGLILSLVFIAAASTRDWTYEYWLKSRGDHLAQMWFEFMRTNQPQKAYDLTVHSPSKHPDESATAKTPYQKFLELPPVAKILQLGPRAHPIQAVPTSLGPEGVFHQTIFLWYQVAPADKSSDKPYIVQMQQERRLLPEGREQWSITGVWEMRPAEQTAE